MKKTLLILPLVSYLLIMALKYLSDYITKDLAKFEKELQTATIDR